MLHVRIKSRQHDNGAIRFYLVDQGGSSIDFNINRPKFDLKSHKGLIKTMICLNVHAVYMVHGFVQRKYAIHLKNLIILRPLTYE